VSELRTDALPAPERVRPRRLLVIGASPMRAAAFATWRSMGLEVVLVDGHSGGRYEDLVNEFWALDARDGSADVARLTEIARSCDGVTTAADDSQATAAAIAEDLGMVGIGREAAAAARSKARQRALCERTGMPVPRWKEVRQADDVHEFFFDGPRPAVLKPVDSAGGAAAMRVTTSEEAVRHWPVVRTLSRSRTGILEDFIEAPRELCVDAVVAEKRPVFVSIAECIHLGTIGFVCTSAAYATHQEEREDGRHLVEQLVSALGFSDGVVHAEFKVDGDVWTMLETALRPGGAYLAECTVRVTGVDLYEAQARLAIGEDPPVPAARQPVAPYAQTRFLVGEGQVRNFVPPAKIVAQLPDVKVVNQQLGPGQLLRVPLSDAGRGGYALGWGSDRESLDAQLRQAIALLGREMGVAVVEDDGTVRTGIAA
jgi:biotin carboxylase